MKSQTTLLGAEVITRRSFETRRDRQRSNEKIDPKRVDFFIVILQNTSK